MAASAALAAILERPGSGAASTATAVTANTAA
jgi:hypothetical protein